MKWTNEGDLPEDVYLPEKKIGCRLFPGDSIEVPDVGWGRMSVDYGGSFGMWNYGGEWPGTHRFLPRFYREPDRREQSSSA